MSKTCGSSECEELADWTVHWPGQSLPLCDVCKDRAEGVAKAMGFELASTPLKKSGR